MAAADDDTRALLIPGQCDIRGYGVVADGQDSTEGSTIGDSEPEVQDGVRRIEAVARTWSRWGLMVAYMRSVVFPFFFFFLTKRRTA